MKLDVKVVASQAHGRWLEIFQYVCPGIFDEAIANLGVHVRCPLHGGDKDFRFIKRSSRRENTAQCGVAMCTCGVFNDGFALLQRATGKPFFDVLREVDEYLNGPLELRNTQKPKPRPVLSLPVQDDEETLEKEKAEVRVRLAALWKVGTPVNTENAPYYAQRGIDPSILSDVRDLRAIRQLGYYERLRVEGGTKTELVKTGAYPALLGLLRDSNGEPVAIHRTWLSEDALGKAPVEAPKKLTRAIGVSGAAIRLFPIKESDTLALCEGIETALAVRQLSREGLWSEFSELPVWACFSARNMQNFVIPPKARHLKRIVIFTDNDANGTSLDAANKLKERFAVDYPHIEVLTRTPAVEGWDWLDHMVNNAR